MLKFARNCRKELCIVSRWNAAGRMLALGSNLKVELELVCNWAVNNFISQSRKFQFAVNVYYSPSTWIHTILKKSPQKLTSLKKWLTSTHKDLHGINYELPQKITSFQKSHKLPQILTSLQKTHKLPQNSQVSKKTQKLPQKLQVSKKSHKLPQVSSKVPQTST